MKKLAFALVAVGCVGCFSMGKRIDQAAMAKIKEGETTKGQVVKLLGNPDNVSRNPWSGESWTYYFARAASRPESFIPVVGAFAGGGSSQSEMLMLTFDGKDVVQQVWSNTGGTTFGYGLATEDRATDIPEPRAGKEEVKVEMPLPSGPGQ